MITRQGLAKSTQAKALTAAVARAVAALPNGTRVNVIELIDQQAKALKIRAEITEAVKVDAERTLARRGDSTSGVVHHREIPAPVLGPVAGHPTSCGRCGERLGDEEQAEIVNAAGRRLIIHANCYLASDEIA